MSLLSRRRITTLTLCFLLSISCSFAQTNALDSLKQLLTSSPPDTQRLSVLLELCNLLFETDARQTGEFAAQAIELATELDSMNKAAKGYYFRGVGHFYSGNLQEAKLDVAKSLELVREYGNAKEIMDATNVLSIIVGEMGEYNEAVEYQLESLAIAEEIQDSSRILTAMANLGSKYIDFKDTLKATQYWVKSLDYAIALQDTYVLGTLNINLAATVMDHDSSIYLSYKAMEYFEAIGQQHGMAYAYQNTGSRYGKKKDYLRAITNLQKAIDIWSSETFNYKPGLISCYMNMAAAKGKLGNLSEAEELFDKAILMAREINHKGYLRDTYEEMADFYEEEGDYEKALLAYKEFTALKDTLLDEKKVEDLANAETRYNTEKVEKDLALAQLEIAQQANTRNRIIIGGILLLAALGGLILFLRNQQRIKERENQLALQFEKAEAERLREIDRLKSNFFANISHEFRTPLTLILGPLNQFISGKSTGDPNTLYRMMRRNANRLLQLINQLLDLSKLEAGRMELHLVRTDIIAFLRALAGNFESLASSKDIHFHTHFPNEALQIAFDIDKLEKTVNNLLSNAFKFTPDEGIIRMEVELLKNDLLEIRIQDNGIGIPESQLEYIFDRFYQLEGSEYEGTGIGLALVKELVELHRGEISVSSQAGQGSLFIVRLPVWEEGEIYPFENTRVGLSDYKEDNIGWVPIEENTDKRKPLLLLVEDNPDVRQYLSGILGKSYRLLEAEDGQQGQAIAQEEIPDLVISDVMMPNMDGNTFTRKIKEDTRTSHIPVILLTAKAGRESKIEGLETGADDYLAKPFDEEELLIRVRNLIEQRKRLREQFGKDIVRISPDELVVESADKVFLDKVIKVIETYMGDEAFSIEDLGSEVALSRSQLHRKIKALTDQSPSVFLRTIRLKRAHQLLTEKVASIAEISFLVGFSSPAYFSKCFKDQFGYSPGQIDSHV